MCPLDHHPVCAVPVDMAPPGPTAARATAKALAMAVATEVAIAVADVVAVDPADTQQAAGLAQGM